MEYNLTIQASSQLDLVDKINIKEIILAVTSFSRIGQIDDSDLSALIDSLHSKGKELILLWDVLSTDNMLSELGNKLAGIDLNKIKAIRFHDPGVGYFLSKNFQSVETQFIMDSGNLNLTGIKNWGRIFSPQLKRLVLSNQLPLDTIREYRKELDLELEILGLGRLEILYTPRHLVSPHFEKLKDKAIELEAASEDRPDQFNPVIENNQGTFVFYDKDISLLQSIEEIEEAGIDIFRIVPYELEQFNWLSELFKSDGWQEKLQNLWKRRTFKGFFRANKSNSTFKKLTNQFIAEEKNDQIGVVLESVKSEHMVLEINKPIELPIEVLYISPEGKRISRIIESVSNLSGDEFRTHLPQGYYKLPWVKFVVPGTIIKEAIP